MSAKPILQSFPAKTENPKANVLVLHGYAEHSGRFQRIISAYQEAGYDVWTYDQRNHGTYMLNDAVDQRDHAVVDVRELVDDHLAMRQEVLAQARCPKLFIFGHSMGGLISATSALSKASDLSGVVLSGPAFLQNPSLPSFVSRILLPIAKVFPRLPIGSIDAGDVVHDPKVQRAYQEDPLNYLGKIPLLTGVSMAFTGAEALKNSKNWSPHVPLKIFHGEDDRLALVEGSRRFVKDAGGELVEIPGGFHEFLQEPDADQWVKQIVEWTDKQLES